MFADLRHAVRSLAKSPGHTTIALITLALGIGLNTSMFSLVNTLLFRMAPYPEAERIVRVAGPIRGAENRSSFSHLEIEEMRPELESLGAFTATQRASYAWAEPGRPAERIGGGAFSANLMDTFRVQPILGRPFSTEEFTPGKGQVVLLSENFWRARYAADHRPTHVAHAYPVGSTLSGAPWWTSTSPARSRLPVCCSCCTMATSASFIP